MPAAADDDGTVATANLDLSATHSKMRRVLGRNWVVVMSELKKKGARNGELFRDELAKSGVPLTGKEVRAFGLQHGPDLAKGLQEVFAAPAPAKGAAGVAAAAPARK